MRRFRLSADLSQVHLTPQVSESFRRVRWQSPRSRINAGDELGWMEPVTMQSGFGWLKSSMRSSSLAIAGQCLLWVVACGGEEASPRGPGNDELDVADDGAEDDDDVPANVDNDDDDTAPVPSPSLDAGKRDATIAKPAADGGTTSVTPDVGQPGLDGGTPVPSDDDDDEPAPAGGGDSPCLDGITDYGPTGKFEYEAKTAGRVKFWVPKVPAGCKVPIVHLANGTGASCSNYGDALKTLASHGFLAACYENTNTGAGTQGLEAFEMALEMFPDLALKKFGSTGHSQGGQAAFTVLALTEAKFGPDATYAGLAMQPASGFGTQPAGGSWQSVYAKIKSPMFMFSGTADTLVSEAWVKRGFDALDKGVEAYNWSAKGATHIPTPQKEQQEVSIPWFRWKLLGDKNACEFFKKLPMGTRWVVKQEQNVKPCE
jgi:hypothetical protein